MLNSLNVNIQNNSNDPAIICSDDFTRLIGMIKTEIRKGASAGKIIFIDSIYGEEVSEDIDKIIDIYGDDPETLIVVTVVPNEVLAAMTEEKLQIPWDKMSEDQMNAAIESYYNETAMNFINWTDNFLVYDNRRIDGIHYIYKNEIGKAVYNRFLEVMKTE